MSLLTTGKKLKAFFHCTDPDFFPSAADFDEHEDDFEDGVYISNERLCIDGVQYLEMVNAAYQPANAEHDELPLDAISDTSLIEILAGDVGQWDESRGTLVDYFKKWEAKYGHL